MEDKERTFNVAEINFFSHWFDSKNASVQASVQELVKNGRLGFNEGGWVQPGRRVVDSDTEPETEKTDALPCCLRDTNRSMINVCMHLFAHLL